MTGTGIVNLIHAKNILSWSLLVCATINEIVRSFDDSFSKELTRSSCMRAKYHRRGNPQKFFSDSKLIRKREDHFL